VYDSELVKGSVHPSLRRLQKDGTEGEREREKEREGRGVQCIPLYEDFERMV